MRCETHAQRLEFAFGIEHVGELIDADLRDDAAAPQYQIDQTALAERAKGVADRRA
jgi:hypothetical protein